MTHKTFRVDVRAGSDQDLHDLSIALRHGFVEGRIATGAFGCVDIRARFNQKPNYLGVTPIYRVEKRDIPPNAEGIVIFVPDGGDESLSELTGKEHP